MSAVGYALAYQRRGWPVLPVEPAAKRPLTAHGVRDATTDPAAIRRWFERWPDANVGIATGAPGPQVLDVDDLVGGRDVLSRIAHGHVPTVATARGRHLYFAGEARGTVKLAYGELRGTGSFVVAPPSVHETGRAYVWTRLPDAEPPLEVPSFIVGAASTAGCGEHRAPAGRVAVGGRHPYLLDVAVRLVRAGFTDEHRIAAHLRCEFELSCETTPRESRGYFEALASWAARSRIAERERRTA